METSRWRVVDEKGAPVEGARVTQDEDSVRVLDPLGLREVPHVVDADGRLVVERREVESWLVSGAPASAGNEARLFIDSDMFEEIVRAVDGARETVHVTQLLLYPEFCATYDADHRPRALLLDRLLAASRRGAHVRILLNENRLIPDTANAVRAACEDADCMEVRTFPMTPNVFHVKLLVVDGREAFVVGPPFEQKYWDTNNHAADDPRRDHPRPLHDVCLRLRGPAVGDIDRLFCDLWGTRGAPLQPCPPPPPYGKDALQLVATLPRGLLPTSQWLPRGAREGYQRAFGNAQAFVYLETQYFTSPSITRAIAAALDAKPDLQVILVLNMAVDVPFYLTWQKRRLAELGYPGHPRLGVFTLWSPGVSSEKPVSTYVHSKLAFCDDAWASIGTANLDSLSLEKGEEFGIEVESNVDLNVLVLDGIEGGPRTGQVAAWRRRIWAEHLGDHGVWRATPPPGGWLALWREVAHRNAVAATEGRFPERGRILPYEPEGGKTAREQAEAYLSTTAHDLRDAARRTDGLRPAAG